MALIRFEQIDPARHMLTLQEELDAPAQSLIQPWPFRPRRLSAVNIFDDHEGVVIIAELPGLDPASIKVAGQGDTLTNSGIRARDEEAQGRGYHRRERRFGEFSRRCSSRPDGYPKAEAR